MEEKEVSTRGKWRNPMEFMMSCLGYSVGVGSLWRFPYICIRNGGGAFLIVSVIFLVVCGIPLFFMESCLGQYFSLSPLKLWKICPLFQGIGIAMVIMSTIFSIYYNTLVVWVLFYMSMSFQSPQPWTTCGNSWNTVGCIPIHGTNSTATIATNISSLNNSGPRESLLATEEFWMYNVLDLSPGVEYMGNVKWQLVLCVFVAWFIVFVCLCKGVFSSRIAVYITAPAPFILLTILLVRGATLPGSIDGIVYYVTPDWERLTSFQVWVEAFIYGFYSLGNGWGAIITLGSYNNFHDHNFGNAVIISVADFLAAVYCGFALFTVLGYMAHETGVTMEEIRNSDGSTFGMFLWSLAWKIFGATYPHNPGLVTIWAALYYDLYGPHTNNQNRVTGIQLLVNETDVTSEYHKCPGLIFITYPHTASLLPVPQLWTILFFLTCIFLAVDSQFGALKTLTSGLFDIYPEVLGKRKVLVTLVVCICGGLVALIFVCQGGMYYFQIVDWYSSALAATLIVFCEAIVIAWLYGADKFAGHVRQMMPNLPNSVLMMCKFHWKYILPVFSVFVFVITLIRFKPPTFNDYVYPPGAIVVGWILGACVALPIPVVMVYGLLTTEGTLIQRLKTLIKPSLSVRSRHRCEKCPQYPPEQEMMNIKSDDLNK